MTLRYAHPVLTNDRAAVAERVAALDAPLRSAASVVVALLDRSSALEDVFAGALAQGVDVADIFAALEWLETNALLFESSIPPAFSDDEMARYRAQIAMFDAFLGAQQRQTRLGGVEAQLRLKCSSIVLVGAGPAWEGVLQLLVRSGTGRIIAIPTAASDEAESLVAAARSLNPHVAVVTATSGQELDETLAESSPDLLVACFDVADDDLCDYLNTTAVSASIPLLVRQQLGTAIEIGPLVTPGVSACLTCYGMRKRGAHAPITRVSDAGALLASPDAGVLCLDVVKMLTGIGEPLTVGRLWRFDLLTGTSELHTVLKLPRCPSCGVARSRPPRRLWDG